MDLGTRFGHSGVAGVGGELASDLANGVWHSGIWASDSI